MAVFVMAVREFKNKGRGGKNSLFRYASILDILNLQGSLISSLDFDSFLVKPWIQDQPTVGKKTSISKISPYCL